MTVAELRTLLDGQPDEARVLVFDHLNTDPTLTTTITANCILSMNSGGPVAIICNQDDGDKELSAPLSSEAAVKFIQALSNPPEPVAALVEAAEHYRSAKPKAPDHV